MQNPPPIADGARAPLTLLMVATSPSDLTELEGTARAFAQRGHQVTLAYFYSGGSRQVHHASLEKMRIIRQTERNVQIKSVDVDRSIARQLAAISAEKVARKKQSWLYARLSALRARIAAHINGKDPRGERYVFLRRLLRLWDDLPALLLGARGNFRHWRKARFARWRRRWLRLMVRVRGPYRVWLTGVRAVRRVVSKFIQLHMSSIYTVISATQLWRIYKSYALLFDTMLQQRHYDAIVVPEDVVGPFWPQLIHAGLRQGIATIILPYTLANQEEAFKSLRGVPEVQTRRNWLAAFAHPRWRLQRDGADIVRMPAGHIFVQEWMGTAPPDPWMMNSGSARLVCVDSQASYDYFHRAGIPAEQLLVTGSVSQDELARMRQDRAHGLQQLRQELGFTDAKPLLLISGCPNQLAGWVPHCEFADMAAVAAHLGEALRPLAAHYHLVVRPHPNYVEFGDLMRAHGVLPSMRPTAQLVPLADVFVAFASATIRWGAACGIPVVNYDIFHYGYADFAANQGVTTVSEPADFVAAVARLVPGSAACHEARERSERDAAYWSVMDGRGLERIEGVLRRHGRLQRA